MMYLLVLATYKKSHGDADPPFCLKVKEANGQEVQLGEWCDRMRTEYSKQTLATAKIAKAKRNRVQVGTEIDAWSLRTYTDSGI